MNKFDSLISWAPRVSRERILQLYIKAASGINDEELIDDVAYSFYYRCSDIVRISERRFACPLCRGELPHPHPPGNDLYCSNCGWRMSWREYFLTYRGKQLSVNSNVHRHFLDDLPECKSPQDKMILIDSLIHACHENVIKGMTYYTRPLAVNLIDGTMNQVIAFLENLPYGPDSLPEMSEQLVEWRKRCLSLMSDLEVERDQVTHLVDSMPRDLKTEIEEMITKNHRQKAVTQLTKIEDCARELKFLRGTIARQMVRIIEKRMKRQTSASKTVQRSIPSKSSKY